MNTEQLNTAEEIATIIWASKHCGSSHVQLIENFASHESKIAVDEFKEKLRESIRNEMKPEIVSNDRVNREPDFLFGCEKCLDLIDKL